MEREKRHARFLEKTENACPRSCVPGRAESRTARLPDSNRRWLSFGGSYATSMNMTVDFGYAHLFVSDAPINRTSALQDKLVGTFKNQIDILSAQVGWNFLAIACHSDQLKQTWTSIALAPKHGGLGSGRRATKITSPYCPLGGEGQNILKRYTVSL